MAWRFFKEWWAAQSSPAVFIKADKTSWAVGEKIFKLTTWAIAIGALKALHVKTSSSDIAFVAKWLGILWMWLVTISMITLLYRAAERLPKFPQNSRWWIKAIWYVVTITISAGISLFVTQYAINETTRIFSVVVEIIAKGNAQ